MKISHIKINESLLLLLVLFLLPVTTWAANYEGRTVGIHDGDTFTLLVSGNQTTKIRLAEIDAPESEQPYGNRSRQELSDLIFGKYVTVNIIDTDRYGRTVGRVFTNGQDVNAEMVKRGAAWVYRKYVKEQSLFNLESEARLSKRGLWSLPESQRVPPWEWRHSGNSENIQTNEVIPQALIYPNSRFSCEGKSNCRQMKSCAEARFYLSNCGLSSLDGDQDGIPCASLCR